MSIRLNPDLIESKILIIRGHKVMLDRDLALLYGVETEVLTRQVRRNIERFPPSFLIILTKNELKNLIHHFDGSSWGGVRKPPMAFTEHGILMLSSVLRSKRAIQVNIKIIETFIRLRELMLTHKELAKKIEELEAKFNQHDENFVIVFEAIKRLIDPPTAPKPKIGFHP